MIKSDDRESKTRLAADEHFRQYERLVSGWIDVFLETQKAVITHSPSPDTTDTGEEDRRQEGNETARRAIA